MMNKGILEMKSWFIHRNTRVNQYVYILDAEGSPVTIDPALTYKCQIKGSKDDASPVLTFVTGGGVGVGSIAVLSNTPDGHGIVRDWFIFTTPDETLPASVEAGAYVADLVKIGSRDWVLEMQIIVDDGVTSLT